MRGKSIALLVLALGCGLVAALGITQVLAHRPTDTVPTETVPVIIAAGDVPPFSMVASEMVKSEDWPKDRVPAGAIVRAEDVVGRFTKVRMFGGELVIEPKLLAKGAHPNNENIAAGLRVVTVPVEIVAIGGGLILPNSRVDVQLHVRKGTDSSIPESMTKTILQDIRVFAINDVVNVEAQDKKAETRSLPGGRTASLLVTPQQANIVTAAAELGTLRLIMRSAEDKAQLTLPPVTPKDLLSVNDGMNREKETRSNDKDDQFKEMYRKLQEKLQQASQQKVQAPEPSRWSVRLLAAGEVHDVVLQTFDQSDDAVWSARGMPERQKPAAQPPAAAAGGSGPNSTPPGAGAGLPNGVQAPQPNGASQPNSGASSGSGKVDLFRPTSPSP